MFWYACVFGQYGALHIYARFYTCGLSIVVATADATADVVVVAVVAFLNALPRLRFSFSLTFNFYLSIYVLLNCRLARTE